jgi:hypothetical protein
MAYAFIRNNIVENIAPNAPPAGWSIPGMSVVQSDTVKVGDIYDGSTFTTPGAPVPKALSRRQFIIGMLNENFITSAEADALSATGAIPTPFAAVVSQLPAQQQVAARVTIRTATEFYRDNALMLAGLSVVGATTTQLDEFFRKYSAV